MNKEKMVQEAVKMISNQKRHIHHHKNKRDGHKAILFYLLQNGGQALSGEIAQNTGISTPRLAYMLKELENDGMITRSYSSDDHRKVYVSLTKKGNDKLLHRRKNLEESVRRLFDSLTDNDIEALFRILSKVNELEQEDREIDNFNF
ncbi:MAG: MarR family winged helix-turn-helix transcriptional regulator [Candidatus Coprovivens sp.]